MVCNIIRHLFILYIIKLVIFNVYVSGKPVDDDKIKTELTDKLRILANNVCSILDEIFGTPRTTCEENTKKSLPSPNASSLQSSRVKIRCRTEHRARFQIEPSENWQLVVIIPLPYNESDSYLINSALMAPWTEYEKLYTYSTTSYTLWSTELVDDAPILWRGGETVPPYDPASAPAHKNYDVTVNISRADVKNNVLLDALLQWNTYGDDDVCFDVVNTCNKVDQVSTSIMPDSKPENLFKNLQTDDLCKFQVIGLYGTTVFEYKTPPCDDYTDCIGPPASPENVMLLATPEGGDTWAVRVTWSPPRRAVEMYNLSLHNDDNFTLDTLQVLGDKTEAVFNGVSGEGLYYVEMHAIRGHKAAVTSRRAIFPPVAGRGGWLGAGAVALALGGAALALACLWRRAEPRTAPPDYIPDDKPAKKSDIEAVSMIVESVDSWEVRSDKLLLHEVIGEGAFGVVRRATLAPHGTNVAVKMLKDFPSLEEIRSFRSEMELMKSVGVHPHLVSLVGCCSGRRPLIIAEYCSRGDLLTYLRCTWDVMVSKRNAKYYNNNIDTSDYRNDLFKCKIQTENSKLVVNKLYELQDICDRELTSLDLLSFCRQIAMGMEFLAANRVVHRDLAARNILVTGDRTLKIADFGLSRDVYEENQYKQKGNGKMPVKWMALESLTRRIYTTQSDVWSFGVVVWEVATVGAAPYASVPAARLPRLLRAGYRMPRPANCSPQLYDIMLWCWRTLPRERPTFGELHARLDELLNSASAHHYLSLELEPELADAPPTPRHHRYIKMFMRGKRNWSRGESYERPLKPLQSNYYTAPPVVLTKTPPV